jgi:5'-phosphate synthase pdxT subunit
MARAGVLALQGSSEPHLEKLRALGTELGAGFHEPVEVRRPAHLDGLTHLILPGGESTTIRRLLDLFGLTRPIVERFRAGELALYGTCAGAILLGQDDGTPPPRLGLLDATVERNAFGRQVDSFTRELDLSLDDEGAELEPGGTSPPFHGVFIRAPRFTRIGPSVRVLASLDGEPILVEAPGLLAGSFHPELGVDLRVHRHFLAMAGAPAATSPRASVPA